MTKDDVIRLATKAGFSTYENRSYILSPSSYEDYDMIGELEVFAKLVEEHEREACAKVADELVGQDLEHNFSALIAHNIRARGEK